MIPSLERSNFLLLLVIFAFLFREIFFAAVFPLFTGQDEARHYNTVQWLTYQAQQECQGASQVPDQDKENLATYRFSEEIRETSNAAALSTWRQENYRKPNFPDGPFGVNETAIRNNTWTQAISCPPDIVPTATQFSFFHWLGSIIEHSWKESDIQTRFYLIHILSVVLGAFTVLFAYLASREARFSERVSLLIALIISLQPRLSIYTTNINYDTLLIPFFAFFLFAGLRFLRLGITPLNLVLLVSSFIGAVLTKGTGLALLGGIAFLLIWLVLKKRTSWRQVPLSYWIIGSLLLLILSITLVKTYTFSRLIPTLTFSSLFEYLGKSLPRIPSSSENFWGTVSWNASTLGPWFVYAIWIIEALALAGLIRFFYLKESLSFLPIKTTVLFCLVLVLSLQAGVRLHDWHVFQETGSLALGTPGRYFLPALLPQLLLIAVGLGALLRGKLALERALVGLALIMLAFNFYTVWLIIIPRFYL